jgi:hypothetical protein
MWKKPDSPETVHGLTFLADSFLDAWEVFEAVMDLVDIVGIVRKDEQ